MASPLADYVVLLGRDGRVAGHDSVSDALRRDRILAKELAEGPRAVDDDEKKIDAEGSDEVGKPADGKLILAEEVAEGNVSWDAGGHLCSAFPSLKLTGIYRNIKSSYLLTD